MNYGNELPFYLFGFQVKLGALIRFPALHICILALLCVLRRLTYNNNDEGTPFHTNYTDG